MSILTKVGIFCVFLIVFALWIYVNNLFLKRLTNALVQQRGYLLLTLELGMVSYIAIFVFIWLLSGFIDLHFVGLACVAQLISIMLTSFCWFLLGSLKTDWEASLIWEGFSIGLRYPWLSKVDIALGYLVIGFLFVCGWVYFTNEIPSTQGTIRILQTTITFIASLGIIASIKSSLPLLSSPTMIEHTRDRLFVAHISGFISLSLMISLILWAFGINQQNVIQVSSIPFDMSPKVLGILVAFLLVVYVLPYMIGIQRSKILRQEFDGKIEKILMDAGEILKSPNSQQIKFENLSKLQIHIEDLYRKTLNDFPQLNTADDFEKMNSNSELPKELELIKSAYEQIHDSEPCIQHVNYLDKLYSEINDLKATLLKYEFIPPRRPWRRPYKQSLDDMLKVYEARLEQLRGDTLFPKNSKIAVWIVTAASAIASPAISELGKIIIDRIK